jgi:hypothetical protein
MDDRRRILFHGFLLLLGSFVLGLVAGKLGGEHHPHARLWLGAHVTGLMVGTMVLAIGMARPHLELGPRASAVFLWSLLLGNWLGFWFLGVFASAVGAGGPITGQGLPPVTGWQAKVVSAALMAVTLLTFVFCGLGLWGLRKRRVG